LGYKSHTTISNHKIFKDALFRYERELDCASYYVAVSSKYRTNGHFFSKVWNNCKLPDDDESNIRAIVVADEHSDHEYIMKHPLSITHFMESYLLPPFYRQSIFSKYMGFENNTWPHNISIYTDKYIYEGYQYAEDDVNGECVTVPFLESDNEIDSVSNSGYRDHFQYNIRQIEDLNDSVLDF